MTAALVTAAIAALPTPASAQTSATGAGNTGTAGTAGVAGAAGTFTLTSPDLHPGGTVAPAQLNATGCKGGNISPALAWRNAPPGTASYAVTIFDPDAPGRGWWHWAVANIPASARGLPANASASGALVALGAVQARNDFDTDGYGGPCPPPGRPHRYIVTVNALKTATLQLPDGRPALFFDHEIRDATLGSASLTVTYGR